MAKPRVVSGETMAHGSNARARATGGLVFGAVMLIVLGVWEVILGIAAIVRGSFFVVAPNYYYTWNITPWGYAHAVLGGVAAMAGLAVLFTGAVWARTAGIILALFSLVANFFFLPYYPLWSIVLMAVDAFIIWALATGGRTRAEREMMARDYGTMSGREQQAMSRDYTNPPRDTTAAAARDYNTMPAREREAREQAAREQAARDEAASARDYGRGRRGDNP